MAQDKSTRDAFRMYMGERPEQHDYKLAHIPSPLDPVVSVWRAEFD